MLNNYHRCTLKNLSLSKNKSSDDEKRTEKISINLNPTIRNNKEKGSSLPIMFTGPVKIQLLPDNSSCIALLGSQEPAILSQLCSQQLNRIIELPSEVLQCLLASGDKSTTDKKGQRPLAAITPQAMNGCQAGGTSSFTDRARSMLLPMASKGSLRGRSPVPGSRSVDLCSSPSENDRLADQKKLSTGRAVTVSDVSTVKSLCQHLSSNIEVEGLFRVPGNASRVQILRNAILNGSFQNILTNGPFTQHDVASALKSHLSNLTIFPSSTQLAHLIVADSTFHLENQRNQLKENSIKHQAQSTSKPDSDSAKNQPILDFQTSSEKMTSLDLGLTSSIVTSRDWKENEDVLYTFEIQKKKQIEAVKVLFCLLTNNQRSLLKMLFPLLYSVAKKQKTTRMSASNLATLFAPHFFRSSKDISKISDAVDNTHRKCVENWDLTCYALTFMIRHWSKCLEIPKELNEQVVNYLAARNNINALNPAGIEESRANIFKFMKKSTKEDSKKHRSKSASTTVKNRPQSHVC